MLIIISGLQGTGKTTIAKIISKKLEMRLLRTDILIKKSFPDIKYTLREIELVYKEFFSQAEKILKDKKNLILDATFYKKNYRTQAEKLAKKFKIKFIIMEVICSEENIKKRIKNRKDESDADFNIYKKYRNNFEQIKKSHFIIDNSKSLLNTKKQINKFIEKI
jgi:predicted kinase